MDTQFIDSMIDAIRTALASDATAETRIAGADACRSVLAALDVNTMTAPALGPQLATTIAALKGMPVDRALDTVIELLRTRLPSEQPITAEHHAPRFVMLPVSGWGGG